jgi:CRISPR/Cas system-associated protein Csx1
MGLDQYLNKRTYVKNWDHMRPEERHEVTVTKNGKPVGIRPERITYVIEEVGYWRKANQIHAWFVKNVQGGEDDCKEYHVERAALEALLETVNEVIADPEKATELLPTQAGFFFGSTEYTEWYLKDLERTKEILEEALSENNGDYYYESSW